MPARTFKTLLVIGQNHGEVAAKYSADKAVTPYPFADLAGTTRRKAKLIAAATILLKHARLSERTIKEIKSMYLSLRNTTDEEYFADICSGCVIGNDGIARSTINPHAFYRYPITPTATDNGSFMMPFTLLDGTQTYSARKGDVDWSKMHLCDMDVHARAWDLVMEDAEPSDDYEREVKTYMTGQINYLKSFAGKSQYVNHRSAFWCFGVATNTSYVELDNLTDGDSWVSDFYARFVQPLPDATMLTLYEAHTL